MSETRRVLGGKQRAVVAGLAILALLILPSGCKKKEEAKVRAERITNVRTVMPEKKSYRPSLEAIGTLAPQEEVVASAEVDGLIHKVNVEEGGSVQRGMVLATLADRDYLLDVKRAEAALAQAEATLANANAEFERKHALYKEELITKQQHDDIATRLTLARAEVERAGASLALAKERQGKTVILSPLDGVVRERRIQQGSFVRAATPLFSLIKIDPIKLIFSVPEKQIDRVKLGQQVSFQVESLPGQEFSARITLLHPVLEERTRTLKVEAQAANRERLLKPGLFARVLLYTGSPQDIWAIPGTAIIAEGERYRIFVVEGNQAKTREIKPGPKIGDLTGVVSGLMGGEQVVVVGLQNLVEGAKVNVAR